MIATKRQKDSNMNFTGTPDQAYYKFAVKINRLQNKEKKLRVISCRAKEMKKYKETEQTYQSGTTKYMSPA